MDVIGTITGINKNNKYARNNKHKEPRWLKNYSYCLQHARAPHAVWKRKYIPKHKDYSEKYGEIIVEGHYIRYKVAKGGQRNSKCKHN